MDYKKLNLKNIHSEAIFVDDLLGKKFRRNKYGLSDWIDEIVQVREVSDLYPHTVVCGKKNSFIYRLDEIKIID